MIRLRTLALFLTILCVAATAGAGEPGRTVLLVVTGIGGEPAFDEQFHTWAATLLDAASAHGVAEDDLVYLAADPGRDPGRARLRSTRENVLRTFEELAESLPEDVSLFVVVIGHGSYRDGVSKVNLPGPDMTAEDFAGALRRFGGRPIVFAALTSASGGLVPALSGPGRVVVTATKSGQERNASVFARYFAAAFVGSDADADNDGKLSVLEAFQYARHEVERSYGQEQKLMTEHPLLDDNGDGKGSVDPGPDADDGALAATLTLSGPRRAPSAADDPELVRLYREKKSLEDAVADLRRRKASLEKEDYEDRIEDLLVRLALTNRAIREREAAAAE